MTGRVFLIGAGPGDPGLLTLRAKACLEESSVIVYDRLVSEEVLDFAPATAERVYVGKESRRHTVPQADIETLLIDRARRGHTVARLKGGDPFIFGRGAEEAETLRAHGIAYEIVPGVSSAVAAPAYAGIPLTHRSLASGFHVVTGHECLYSTGTPWQLLALTNQTLVILMGIGHLREITVNLIAYGRLRNTPVAVIRWGATKDQEVLVGALHNIADMVESRHMQPPAVIVVGEVVRLRETLDWFSPERMGSGYRNGVARD